MLSLGKVASVFDRDSVRGVDLTFALDPISGRLERKGCDSVGVPSGALVRLVSVFFACDSA